MLSKGFVVAIEGIDGAGKTTQANMLYSYLKSKGIDTILSKEPTESVYGRKIRELAQGQRESTHPLEEYQLFVQDRKLHVENVIKPALAEKKIVILDRYYFSTMAYQGAIGLDPIAIRAENEKFCPIPEMVFLVMISPELGLGRIREGRKETPNAFEHQENLKKVAAIFNHLNSPVIERIEGTASIEQVHRTMITRVDALIATYVSP
jgi:dTMP kinase